MVFFAALVVDGILAGAIYALVALAFVVVYKAARIVNFALGEWVMLGSRVVASGVHVLGLGLAGSVVFGCAGMVAVAIAFNRTVLRRLVGQPLISLLMVTIGLGAVIRGSSTLVFAGIAKQIPLPISQEPFAIHDVPISTDKLIAAVIAAVCIAALIWFFARTRTGVALRAIADDQQVAMTVGIDVDRHFAITWGLVGVLSVLGGTLWTFVTGGGFNIVLVGLKVFPIVIIGGLDSIPGTIVGAIVIGVLENLTAGYLDPLVGGGFSNVASYLVLLAALFVRPYGLFGRVDVQRV